MSAQQLQQMDPRQMAMMMGGAQQLPSPEQRREMEEAETKQIRLVSVQLAVQSGQVTDGAEGLIKIASAIETYIKGGV